MHQDSIFHTHTPIEELQKLGLGNMGEHLGIEFLELGNDFISARMPVDERTRQPMGLLHGGASVVLAETLGSIAANLCVDPQLYYCVGLEINANHIRSARNGYVYGKATPLHIGRNTQVWQIQICTEQGTLVCTSRLTVAVLKRKNEQD